MLRAFFVAVSVTAAALVFAAPSAAAPCDDGGMSSVQYAIDEIILPDTDAGPSIVDYQLSPGAACSTDSECKSSKEKCEGGSCCVRKGQTCTGLGYCCGHPSQGCVNGTCPEF